MRLLNSHLPWAIRRVISLVFITQCAAAFAAALVATATFASADLHLLQRAHTHTHTHIYTHALTHTCTYMYAHAQEDFFIKFAEFEEMVKEFERSRAIYK